MSKVFLYGHTGSTNRGCEAIVRSTIKLLKQQGISDIFLIMPQENMEKKLGIDKLCYCIQEKKIYRYSLPNIIWGIYKKITKDMIPSTKLRLKPILKKIDKDDIVLFIGGDTYCYDKPCNLYAAHKILKRKGAKTILWSCSIEDDLIDDELKSDLLSYDYIFPREIISYNNLINCGIPKDNIIKMSDSAFNLESKKIESFTLKENTVGINISPIVLENKKLLSYINKLVEHIIDNMGMNVLLIPHVYDLERIDGEVLAKIKENFKDDSRVEIIKDNYTCEQLKFVISQCRFFLGARTHATIAAYSSCVPTFVIGYSVKSRGIARDLFDDEKGLMVLYDEIENESMLIQIFDDFVKQEAELKLKLINRMPAYKNSGTLAAKKIFDMGKWAEKKIYFEKYSCSGCGACIQKCPQKCIEMIRDDEGFCYPQLNDTSKCTNCGLCENVCHCKNQSGCNDLHICYGAYNTNEDIRAKSSSGGVFYSIASKIIENNGVVFGAAFNTEFMVEHIYIDQKEDLYKIMGSKYVESNLNNCYSKVKEFLNNKTLVLFSGTPCQIEGLKKYLGKDYDNLIMVDFICHGVPSSKVWKKYLNFQKEKNCSDIKDISFRNKTYGWKNYSLSIEFENGNKFLEKVDENYYLRGFIGDFYLRPSCYNCSAKGTKSSADITLADFWHIEKTNEIRNDNRGISIVMIHSDKAIKLLEKVKDEFVLFKTNVNDVIKYQPSLINSSEYNNFRSIFFKKLEKYNLYKLMRLFLVNSFFVKVRKKIYIFLGK